MTKSLRKGKAAKPSGEDRNLAAFLGVDASTLTLARAGKLELPEWWESIFGYGADDPTCADAYRDARISFELGEAESSKNAKSKRYGNLAWIAATNADATGLAEFWWLSGTRTKIPKRDRKKRMIWVSRLSFLLARAGVYLAVLGRNGLRGWQRLVDSGWIEFRGRASGDGDRVLLTDKGKRRLSRCIGSLGRAWNFCPSACEWYLCSMVLRLRGIFEDPRSPSRRRDVIAALLANEESKQSKRPKEIARISILEKMKLLPVARTSKETEGIRSIVAKDSKVIRDVAKAHNEDAKRRRNTRAKQSKE